jgi:hypothetical protein
MGLRKVEGQTGEGGSGGMGEGQTGEGGSGRKGGGQTGEGVAQERKEGTQVKG